MDNNNTDILDVKNSTPFISYTLDYWLIQIPTSKLSYGAKCLYARLLAWKGDRKTAFRSIENLSIEMNVSRRTINRRLKELKDFGLIQTFQNQFKGVNNYTFPHHPAMNNKYTPVDKSVDKSSKSVDKSVDNFLKHPQKWPNRSDKLALITDKEYNIYNKEPEPKLKAKDQLFATPKFSFINLLGIVPVILKTVLQKQPDLLLKNDQSEVSEWIVYKLLHDMRSGYTLKHAENRFKKLLEQRLFSRPLGYSANELKSLRMPQIQFLEHPQH